MSHSTPMPTPDVASIPTRIALCVLLTSLAACAGQSGGRRPARAPAPPVAPPSAGVEPVTPPPPRVPVVVPGSGTLIAPPGEESARPAPPAAGAGGFQLGFVDTDIAAIVAAVLGEGLGARYSIDPAVKGTMTLQAARPLTREEVLEALEVALRAQGFALIEAADAYSVVPLREAPRRVPGVRLAGAAGHGFGIYVVPLQYVGAEEMQKTLQPFAPEGGILRVDAARNLLVLAGTSQEIATLQSVIKTFDVDWLTGMSFELYPLEYVDAKTLASELAEVFSDTKSPLAGVVRIVPMARLNSLMVVTSQAKYLREVEEWIHRLDLGLTTPGRRIYVYDVQNGKADELAASLSAILSLAPAPPTPGSSAGGTRSPSTGFTAGSLGTGGSSSLGSVGLGSSFGNAGAPAPSPVMPAAQGVPGPAAAGEPGGLRIVPSAENNSLLIYANPAEFAGIESALKRLDVQPIQVLIEASIAEVTLNDQTQYGLQWAYQGPKGPVAFSQGTTATPAQQFPGFSYLYTGTPGISAVLNALESITHVNVLSAPKLLVLNNHEADLEVGDQVPVITQSAVSTAAPGAPIVSSVQMIATGVILHVTPRANKSGRVALDIDQEVSNTEPTTSSGINSPTIQQRRISSSVSVRDGDTIALGG